MNLSHYSKLALFAPFSASFRVASWSIVFKYRLRSDSKTCEKNHQKSQTSNTEIGSWQKY